MKTSRQSCQEYTISGCESCHLAPDAKERCYLSVYLWHVLPSSCAPQESAQSTAFSVSQIKVLILCFYPECPLHPKKLLQNHETPSRLQSTKGLAEIMPQRKSRSGPASSTGTLLAPCLPITISFRQSLLSDRILRLRIARISGSRSAKQGPAAPVTLLAWHR